jgi:hypothetical protein
VNVRNLLPLSMNPSSFLPFMGRRLGTIVIQSDSANMIHGSRQEFSVGRMPGLDTVRVRRRGRR